ncbi:MAG: hypothetical protein EPO40_31180 [Myxococcaceae bacterium]|nr:MAG: hypothetical protein EPO40_31180 [Myxococcaceae bacterium]
MANDSEWMIALWRDGKFDGPELFRRGVVTSPPTINTSKAWSTNAPVAAPVTILNHRGRVAAKGAFR